MLGNVEINMDKTMDFPVPECYNFNICQGFFSRRRKNRKGPKGDSDTAMTRNVYAEEAADKINESMELPEKHCN